MLTKMNTVGQNIHFFILGKNGTVKFSVFLYTKPHYCILQFEEVGASRICWVFERITLLNELSLVEFLGRIDAH